MIIERDANTDGDILPIRDGEQFCDESGRVMSVACVSHNQLYVQFWAFQQKYECPNIIYIEPNVCVENDWDWQGVYLMAGVS